jgi:TrmH family RNA methyltransferase
MITSVMNKKIKHISQLNRRAKERRVHKEFVVEGKKMFVEAPREWIREIYVSESFLLKEENKKIIEDYTYEIVQDDVFGKISATVTPQGILCVLNQPNYTIEDLMNHENPLLVGLEDLQDPGNLGTILRTGEGAGVTGVLMTKETADIFNPKVIRATMGSIYRVPFLYVEDFKEHIVKLKENGFSVVSADLSGKNMYDQESYLDKTMFLIGNEGNGLKKETSDLANIKIRIPMHGQVESLNAAMATGILIYEANRQRRFGENLHVNI